MSIQSMKYHNLPTAKQIEAYNSGRMSTGERKWMDSMIKRNPFVKESVEAAKSTDMAAVGRISTYVSSNVTSQYLVRAGFWSKYGGWISFSSIVIFIGLGVYFGPDLYQQYSTSENIVEVDGGQVAVTINEEVSDISDGVVVNSAAGNVDETKTISDNTAVKQPEEVAPNSNQQNEDLRASVVSTDNSEEKKTFNEVQEKKKEIIDPAPIETKLSVLSVKKVAISSKVDPEKKSTSNFPIYPNGDLALCDYFKNALRPIQVPDADKYAKKATIDLEISAKGRVLGSSISGNIHPTHESALKSAIANLSKFEAGKSKVHYSVVVTF